ncbi:MAG TPA: hypothetical protein VHN79_06880, partial [Lacunisphaera sp.]|nr:hypothetical protein [Lacunisphaera sp.]
MGFSISEEALYLKTAEAVLAQLRKSRNPADLLPVLRVANKRYDRAYDQASPAARVRVACRAGCGTCCHVPVGVQAHEVLIASSYIQARFNPEKLDAVLLGLTAH